MAKNIELLLLETVEHLGIVGDIVKVKPGYARNYLLPHLIAEFPTEEKIESLKEARAAAQAELQALRSAREELLGRMEEVEITLQRSCNDQGVLYGSVTQRDIADALQEAGYDVGVRSVRLSQTIRRVGDYSVPVQFEKDLRTEINLTVIADRSIEDEREEMEFDNEGELIIKDKKPRREAAPEGEVAEGDAAEAKEADPAPAEA